PQATDIRSETRFHLGGQFQFRSWPCCVTSEDSASPTIASAAASGTSHRRHHLNSRSPQHPQERAPTTMPRDKVHTRQSLTGLNDRQYFIGCRVKADGIVVLVARPTPALLDYGRVPEDLV